MESIRDGFGRGLLKFIKNEPDDILVLSADLSKATKTDKVKELYPDKFIDCGISEANMIGVASGLAENGFKVIMSSFASFITGRYDIIRCSLTMPKSKVLIVGTHSGVAIGKDGVTQMGTEDLNLMIGLPNMRVYQPSSANSAEATIDWILNYDINLGPVYLRIGRQPTKEFYSSVEERGNKKALICKTDWNSLNDKLGNNCNICVVSSGGTCETANKLANFLNADHYDVVCLKPFNGSFLKIKNYKTVICVEDHSYIGGLGDVILRYASENNLGLNVINKALPDSFAESGNPEDLYKLYGLSF